MSLYCISFIVDLGKTIRDFGRGRVFNAATMRRFIRCLVTERRATFLGTITEKPSPFLGIMPVKYFEESLRPVGIAEVMLSRSNRCFRGNTSVTPQVLLDPNDGVLSLFYVLSWFSYVQEIRV